MPIRSVVGDSIGRIPDHSGGAAALSDSDRAEDGEDVAVDDFKKEKIYYRGG
jgi:hypothetical protein